MQERDDALLQNPQQVEKDRDVASLEEQHAAVIASMRSELNAAESAAKAEQQHREELHIAAAKAEQQHSEELQQQKQLFETLKLEKVKLERFADHSSKKTSDHASFVLQASYRHLIAAASSCEYFALQIGLSYDQSPQYVLRPSCVEHV